jgi:hypothetical protein
MLQSQAFHEFGLKESIGIKPSPAQPQRLQALVCTGVIAAPEMLLQAWMGVPGKPICGVLPGMGEGCRPRTSPIH